MQNNNIFIDKKKELAKITSIGNALSNHRGAIIKLHGEVGTGKTLLIHTYNQSITYNHEIIYCRCLDSIFSAELTPLLNFAKVRSNEIASHLDNNSDLTTLFKKLLDFFMNRKKPIIIVIEDIQWANSSILNLLNYFARRLVFSRCMLIISYRTSNITNDHRLHQSLKHVPNNLVHDLHLSILSRESLNQLSYDKQYTDKLFKASSGNPLFLQQLTLLADNSLNKNIEIEDIIRMRIDHLNDNERTLLETLSVIPYPFSFSLLQKLSDSDSSIATIIDDHIGFLNTDINDRYIFQHELLRKTVLAQVSELKQVQFHNLILKTYDELNECPDDSWKLLHTHGANLAEEVINLSTKLAKKSSTISNHSEAAAYLSIAINYAYTTDNETAALLYESWAKEAHLSQELSDKIFHHTQHAINLWKSIGRDDKVGENLYSLSRYYWFNGNPAQAQLLADQAIQTLENNANSTQVAKAYSLRSQLCLLQNEYSDSIKYGKKALSLEKIAKDHEVRTHALNNVGTSMVLSGDNNGRDQLEQSLDLAIEYQLHEHISRGYVNFACCSFHTKDLETAERLVAEGINYGTTHENHSKSSYLSGIAAQTLTEQGKLINAETIALGLLNSNEKTLIVLMPAQNTLARVYSLMANKDAEQKLQQALSNSLAIGEPQYIIAARFNLIEYAWLNDRTELASEQIRKLIKLELSKLDNWRLAELNCWVSRFALELETTPAHIPVRPYQLELNREYLKASEAWSELSMPLNQAICLILNSTETSNKTLLEAYKIAKSCSASGLTNKIRKEANKLGLVNFIPRKGRSNNKDTQQHPLGLTKKEQEILTKILTGKSNSEISIEVSRSPRTIENHVSSILKKFNVKNRLEIILRTQNEPWLTPKNI